MKTVSKNLSDLDVVGNPLFIGHLQIRIAQYRFNVIQIDELTTVYCAIV